MKIAFCGLSHLGLTSAIAYASKGIAITAFDIDNEIIISLNSKKLPILEPGLSEALEEYSHNINFTSDISDLNDASIVYISLDVPTNVDGDSDLQLVENYIEVVLRVLKENQILVILCQVPPGFTSAIRQRHRKTVYQVETLIFGEALERCLNPERIIIGIGDSDVLPRDLLSVLESFECPIVVMNIESAELTKLAINIYLAGDVTITNALSEFANEIGANWWDIREALMLDRRIGKFAYLRPGLGIVSGNLDRDIKNLKKMSASNSQLGILMETFNLNSNLQKRWLMNQISRITNKDNLRIAILGLAYKAGTDSLKNSPALDIINEFRNCEISVYDPIIKEIPNYNIEFSESIEDCIAKCKILIINTPWDEFKNLIELVNRSNLEHIIDPFDVLDHSKIKRLKNYISLTHFGYSE